MDHLCHARGCKLHIRPTLLMCRTHWNLVPSRIQRLVYATYRRGQCDDKRPSREWHEAANAAIGFVALKCGEKVRRVEARALIALGYETALVDGMVKRYGETVRERVLEEIKRFKEEARDASQSRSDLHVQRTEKQTPQRRSVVPQAARLADRHPVRDLQAQASRSSSGDPRGADRVPSPAPTRRRGMGRVRQKV